MIIDQLPQITLPVEDTDEMPIERGQYTYKITLADLLSGASADITVIAAEYDPTATYAVGDYCTYEGLFYICTTAATAEAWTPAHWDEVTVGEELQKAGGVYVGTTEPTDENIKIWLDTDEPGMSAVSSVNGKTGTVVLDLGDIGFAELLWTNASPDSSFGSQTISLDLSGYDFVLIQFYDFNSQDSARARLNTIAEMNSRTALLYGWYSNRVGHRLATVNSTGIQFGNCNYNSTLSNDSAVPLRIFGIKGVVTS